VSLQDKAACTELIQNWGFWRDQGRWAELEGTFHPDGRISVTWFSGPFAEFVQASKRSFGSPKSTSKHLIGLPMLKLSGERAVAETNISILGRQDLDGILVDSVAHARFLDRFEQRFGVWRIVERVAIYEKDTLTPGQARPRLQRHDARGRFLPLPKGLLLPRLSAGATWPDAGRPHLLRPHAGDRGAVPEIR
jgi:hypothetical protein